MKHYIVQLLELTDYNFWDIIKGFGFIGYIGWAKAIHRIREDILDRRNRKQKDKKERYRLYLDKMDRKNDNIISINKYIDNPMNKLNRIQSISAFDSKKEHIFNSLNDYKTAINKYFSEVIKIINSIYFDSNSDIKFKIKEIEKNYSKQINSLVDLINSINYFEHTGELKKDISKLKIIINNYIGDHSYNEKASKLFFELLDLMDKEANK